MSTLNARSASPPEPALLARPDGAPVYPGLVILNDVVVGRWISARELSFHHGRLSGKIFVTIRSISALSQ